MNRPPDYRLIYNWDGAPHGYSPVPQSLDEFLDGVYAPLVDTHAGALFWCVGEHAARWPSDSLEVVGDLFGRRYESTAAYIHTENIRRMLERGEDTAGRGHRTRARARHRRVRLAAHERQPLRRRRPFRPGRPPPRRADAAAAGAPGMAARRAHLGVVRPLLGPVGSRGAAPPPRPRPRAVREVRLGRHRARLAAPRLPPARGRGLPPALHHHRPAGRRPRGDGAGWGAARPASLPGGAGRHQPRGLRGNRLRRRDLAAGGPRRPADRRRRRGDRSRGRGRALPGAVQAARRALLPRLRLRTARPWVGPESPGPQEPPAHARHRPPTSRRRRRRHLRLQLARRRRGTAARPDARSRRPGRPRAARQDLRRHPSPPRLPRGPGAEPTATTACAGRCRSPCARP